MHTFMNKPKLTQQAKTDGFTKAGRSLSEKNRSLGPILYLQRMIGNQAMQRLPKSIPKKFHTAFETAASNRFSHDFSRIALKSIQAKADADKTTEVIPEFQSRIKALKGEPLHESERTFFEPRLGSDLSRVRIYTDTNAAQVANSIQAKAFTIGNDIVFGQGEYLPGTYSGRHLLAHELAHVIQQTTGEGTYDKQTIRRQCSVNDIRRTNDLAEEARIASLPWVESALCAARLLMENWIHNSSFFIAGTGTMTGVPVCAFRGNFNIGYRNPDFGRRVLVVERHLSHLQSRIGSAVNYACETSTNPLCSSSPDGGETHAYVVNFVPPIHFCTAFRNSLNLLSRQRSVIHEYFHFLQTYRGADEEYATPNAEVSTCSMGIKFSGESNELVNMPDSLTGFVMNVGIQNGCTLDVRRVRP